jgi:hypothetical protein
MAIVPLFSDPLNASILAMNGENDYFKPPENPGSINLSLELFNFAKSTCPGLGT